MANVLNFERYSADLQRQILRRIGYTNGLHKIGRFARLVEYLYAVMPTSVPMLVQILIREEAIRSEEGESSERPLKGPKYARGIVDVAQALLLIEKFGPKISLSSQGYACHAINRAAETGVLDTFLMQKMIESDGEYSLNILRLVSEGASDITAIGRELTQRFIALIQFKSHWALEHIQESFARRAVMTLLSDAEKVFRRATEKAGADLFLKHTVAPRLEWLVDLGCLSYGESGAPSVTNSGRSVLKTLNDLGAWHSVFIYLPLDDWLTTELSLPNTCSPATAEDFSWRLAASRHVGRPADHPAPPPDELLEFVKSIYGFVKLVNFNEADALSIYEVLAATHARHGRVLHQRDFETALTLLVRQFPGEIFKLSKRRGRGLYIALKKTA
jgi:hypothetical protein